VGLAPAGGCCRAGWVVVVMGDSLLGWCRAEAGRNVVRAG